jgi:hypothetical protein
MSIAFVTFLGAFYTIVINVLGGAQSIDQRYFQAAKSMGSSQWDIFKRIVLPGTVPSIAVGAAVGMGITWEVVVAAEMISGGGSQSGGSGGGLAIQNLSPFERMILQYYARQVIHRPLVGRRAVASSAADAPEDKGMLIFNKTKKELFELVVLRYETREWVSAEPEDERDFSLLLAKVQTEQIQKMNMMIGFISLFKMEYLVFKVKVMTKKRDKGARCDQSGKTDAITIINTALGLNVLTQGDEYKLTTENTKFRTQKELCVFQEFLLRTFDRKAVNGKKWFFTPCEALLCDIERLHIEK